MMKRYLSPPATFLALWALTLLLFSSAASAQTAGLRTSGLDNFLAETTGTIVCEDFDSLVDINGDPAQPTDVPPFATVSSSQSIALGQLSIEETLFAGEPQLEDSTFITFLTSFDDPQPLVLELDPDLGKLEGFFVETNFLRVSLFDGDTLLDSILQAAPLRDNPDIGRIGWINTQGLNVTRVELSSIDRDDVPDGFDDRNAGGLIGSLKASFLPCAEPPAETCFDQLSDAKAEVEALLATSTGKDAHLLQSVVDCICWTQHDCFWVQPSGDRLTAYGSNVFLGNAYSILYLEHVSDPQADVIIDQLLATLECLVDREIEYAIANGGRQANIDKAMDFADLADVIDDEFDNQVVASLAFKLAWVNAYYATY